MYEMGWVHLPFLLPRLTLGNSRSAVFGFPMPELCPWGGVGFPVPGRALDCGRMIPQMAMAEFRWSTNFADPQMTVDLDLHTFIPK